MVFPMAITLYSCISLSSLMCDICTFFALILDILIFIYATHRTILTSLFTLYTGLVQGNCASYLLSIHIKYIKLLINTHVCIRPLGMHFETSCYRKLKLKYYVWCVHLSRGHQLFFRLESMGPWFFIQLDAMGPWVFLLALTSLHRSHALINFDQSLKDNEANLTKLGKLNKYQEAKCPAQEP